jgi:hypothetical protein
VREDDAGVAASLLNVGQQVGGSVGLAILGTVASSAVAQAAAVPAAAQAGAQQSAAPAAALQAQIYHHALATGFSRGYLVSAGILALIPIIALFMMRISRADLSGAGPAPEPAVTPAHRTWREAWKPRGPDLPARPSARTRGLTPQWEGASRPRARARAVRLVGR